MHTLSSARRTCMASASAVECTATVGMPSSLQARSTRSAISPRLAIRILSNILATHLGAVMAGHSRPKDGVLSPAYVPAIHVLAKNKDVDARHPARAWRMGGCPSLDDHQRLAEFHRLPVLKQNLDHGAAAR